MPRAMRTTHSQSGNSLSSFVAVIAIFVSALSSVAPSPAAASAASKLTYENGRLSVDFTAVRAATAFEEVAKVTGVRVELPEALSEKPLTLTLSSTHPEDAIRQMLRALSVSN